MRGSEGTLTLTRIIHHGHMDVGDGSFGFFRVFARRATGFGDISLYSPSSQGWHGLAFALVCDYVKSPSSLQEIRKFLHCLVMQEGRQLSLTVTLRV